MLVFLFIGSFPLYYFYLLISFCLYLSSLSGKLGEINLVIEFESSESEPAGTLVNVISQPPLCRFPFVSVSVGFTVKKEVGCVTFR